MSQNQVKNKSQDDTLKFIALTTMLIDHIGYLLFPQFSFLRVIGRISFPIFAWLVAKGSIRTHSPLRYAGRLLLFGILSQVPYNFFTQHEWFTFTSPNIFFTLLAGVIMIRLLEHPNVLVKVLAVIPILGAIPLHLSYSSYGLLLILIFHFFSERPISLTVSVLAAGLLYMMVYDNPYQLYAVAAVPLIVSQPAAGIHIGKWVGYLFYPLHLLILFAIYYIWF